MYVMADVPGLIEGAAGGAGLGHEFLRHVTRTKALVHVLDASGGLEGRDPLADFKTINDELRDFDSALVKKPMVVALNKVDLPEAQGKHPASPYRARTSAFPRVRDLRRDGGRDAAAVERRRREPP